MLLWGQRGPAWLVPTPNSFPFQCSTSLTTSAPVTCDSASKSTSAPGWLLPSRRPSSRLPGAFPEHPIYTTHVRVKICQGPAPVPSPPSCEHPSDSRGSSVDTGACHVPHSLQLSDWFTSASEARTRTWIPGEGLHLSRSPRILEPRTVPGV